MIILSILSFVTIIYFSEASRIATIEEKESSELKMGSLEILQKLVNTKDCLAYEYNNTTQKGNLDIEKIESFAANYSNFEPKPAKAVDFDYSIKIRQFPKNFTLYPGKIRIEGKKVTASVLGVHARSRSSLPIEVAYILCNYNPKTEGCKENDIDCDWCGNVSEVIPPYDDNSDPCCWYWVCNLSDCDNYLVSRCSGGGSCEYAFGCNISKCRKCTECSDVGTYTAWCGQGHCTKIDMSKYIEKNTTTNVTIPIGIWGFGVGFGTSSFSPEAARKEKIELVLPITIRYNETTSREGEIKIIAVRGELETITSLVEDVCLKVEKNPNKEIVLKRDLYFTYPVTYNGTHLQMLESYKEVDCGSIPINFENITQRGEYNVEMIYNGSIINVRT